MIMGAIAPYDVTNLYIASNGNDTNPEHGHSIGAPLETIDKLNTITIKAGDSVFFKAGDTFSGQVIVAQAGTSTSPIVITSYGVGAKPIISGAITLTNWVQSGNVWACKPSSRITCLYVNSTRAVLARIPNRLTYTIVHVNGRKTLIEAAEFNAAPNYWVGGHARTKTNGYTYEDNLITSSFYDGLNFATPFIYSPDVPNLITVVVVQNSSTTNFTTLAAWTAYSGLDAHSSVIYKTYPSTTPIDTIFYNPTLHDSTITLRRSFKNLDGTVKTSPFTLAPFSSIILVKDP